jgi:5-methylcytosine-specific restriction endonuclease McrA
MAKKFNRDNWLKNQLRRLSMKYPPAIEAINRTKEVYYITSKTGKLLRRVKFTCEMCGKKDLKRSECELDHVIPVVKPEEGFKNLQSFIEGLFCGVENFKLCCIPCHLIKSNFENLERGPDFRKKKKK